MMKYNSNVNQVKSSIKKANKTALEAIGRASAGYVKAVTPVGQYTDGRVGGALRDSITYQVKDDAVYVGSSLTSEDYPIYVHEGTGRMSAQPYIRSGVMKNLNSLRSIAQGAYKL